VKEWRRARPYAGVKIPVFIVGPVLFKVMANSQYRDFRLA